MELVLDIADTVSKEFMPMPTPGFDQMGIIMDIYTTGTWTLQMLSPGGVWVPVDLTFVAFGVKGYSFPEAAWYRLLGGDVGARAYVANVMKTR